MPLVTNQKDFDALYVASLPPAIAALLKMQPASLARSAAATSLAVQGLPIDYAIDVAGFDPYDMMKARSGYGMTWVPSLLQQPLGNPGAFTLPGEPTQPGQTEYDPNAPPRGSIKVSLDSADYPPYAIPEPVTPARPITSAVGIPTDGGFWAATILARELYDTGQIADGQNYSDPDGRGSFVFHASPSPFAPEHETLWFTQ